MTEYNIANSLRNYMSEKTLMKWNPRFNPQHSLFFSNLVSHIDPNGPLYGEETFEVDLYVNKPSSEISPVVLNELYVDPLNYTLKNKVVRTIKQGELESMKLGIQYIALEKYKSKKVHNQTRYNIY